MLSQFLASASSDVKFLASHPLKSFFTMKGWAESMAMKINLPWPEDGGVHDFVYHSRDGKWVKWDSMLPNADIPEGVAYRCVSYSQLLAFVGMCDSVPVDDSLCDR